MIWNRVYENLDYLSKCHYISDIAISPFLTIIIVFHNWDPVRQAYESLQRFCYIFRNGTVAHGQ